MSGPAAPRKQGVVAILEDAQGRYLFIRRGLSIARAPGFWCFVGGEVEPEEALPAAIEREVREEVGLEVKAQDKVHESISPNGEYLLHWLRVSSLNPAQPLKLHQVEVAEARWLWPDEALKLDPILPGLKAWLQADIERGLRT